MDETTVIQGEKDFADFIARSKISYPILVLREVKTIVLVDTDGKAVVSKEKSAHSIFIINIIESVEESGNAKTNE